MIDKLAWVRIEDNRILTARSRSRDLYYIPGGKREAGEQDEQALLREIREELTVELILDSVRFLSDFVAPAHGQPAGTLVRLSCYAANYRGNLLPSAEIEEMQWLSYADRSRVSAAAQLVFDSLHRNGLLA